MDYLSEIDLEQPDVAAYFDELPLWSAPFGLFLLEHVPLRGRDTILDVGAGTGFLSMELAQRCGPESRVIAVDPWASALDRFRAKLAAHQVSNVEIREGTVEDVDLPADSVDLIVSNLGINNFEDPAAALRRCFHVAREGATILLTTNPIGHMVEFYEVFHQTLADVGRTDRADALHAQEAHRGTTESIHGLLQDAGFRVTATRENSFRLRYASGSALLRHYFIRVGFLGGWKSVLPPEAVEVTFKRLEANLNAYAAENGELALTIPMLCIEGTKGIRE
ncbi:MAG: hypothetical protein DHS20C21_19180 [Gemmatimonadota bacterium]|nr:MAG: hypothetical protein DHS20C21_19180 [Gemmatimonadota bacterium]